MLHRRKPPPQWPLPFSIETMRSKINQRPRSMRTLQVSNTSSTIKTGNPIPRLLHSFILLLLLYPFNGNQLETRVRRKTHTWPQTHIHTGRACDRSTRLGKLGLFCNHRVTSLSLSHQVVGSMTPPPPPIGRTYLTCTRADL